MSTLTYSTAPANTLQDYTRNVAHAIRLLWGALLARKPAQVERRQSRRQKLEAVMMLNGMAQELENTMPNLSAELRYLAARG
jgi:hypothetical protein